VVPEGPVTLKLNTSVALSNDRALTVLFDSITKVLKSLIGKKLKVVVLHTDALLINEVLRLKVPEALFIH